MRRVDPATQYLMLNIDVEGVVPNKRSNLRGVGARLCVEEIAQRPALHPEETPESWNAKFRIHRTGGMNPIDHERMVEVLVDVNRVERQGETGIVHTSQSVSAVAYAAVEDPYGRLTGGTMVLLGEEFGRAKYWEVAQELLSDIVKEYRSSGPA